MFDKWFLNPIPPTNQALNLPFPDALNLAFANPNSDPAEQYVRKKKEAALYLRFIRALAPLESAPQRCPANPQNLARPLLIALY